MNEHFQFLISASEDLNGTNFDDLMHALVSVDTPIIRTEYVQI